MTVPRILPSIRSFMLLMKYELDWPPFNFNIDGNPARFSIDDFDNRGGSGD